MRATAKPLGLCRYLSFFALLAFALPGAAQAEPLAEAEEAFAGGRFSEVVERLLPGSGPALPSAEPAVIGGRASCLLAAAFAEEDQLAQAYLYLGRCAEEDRERYRADGFQSLRDRLAEEERKGKMARVSFSLSPRAGRVRPLAWPDSQYANSDEELFLATGSQQVVVVAEGYEGGIFQLQIDAGEEQVIPLRISKTKEVRTREVDLGAEESGALSGAQRTADPRPKKFPNLLKARYRAGIDAKSSEEPDPPKSSILPWVGVGSGLALIGTGLFLQSRDRKGYSLLCYGTGAATLGGGVYFVVRRSRLQQDSVPRLPESDELILGYRGQF